MTEKASCSRCLKRTDGNPPFCIWLQAEIPLDLADDPECEGFAPKSLRTSVRGSVKRVGETRNKGAKPLKACPKIVDIQAALKLKGFRGSVVMEKICCGKPSCHCQSGTLHGPYPYLHYYSNGKVKRRYLTKNITMLLSHSTEELEGILRETVLGQEGELAVC